MSCLACTTKYGFFTKEVGCPNCGFSFCSKCLKKTIEVPRLNNKKCKVCLSCYDRLQKTPPANLAPVQAPTSNPLNEPLPPDAFEHPVLQPQSEPESTSGNIDDLIQQRINKLKEYQISKPLIRPSNDDIAIRIANLKGERFVGDRKDPAIHLATDDRTDQEKMEDLVKQYMSEAQLDEAADPIKDIERRLAALKGGDHSSGSVQGPSSAGDDASPTARDAGLSERDQVTSLVKRYLDEAAMQPTGGDVELNDEEKEFVAGCRPTGKDQEELPWCVICNEDAELRYEGDLFCKQCYKEVREDDDSR